MIYFNNQTARMGGFFLQDNNLINILYYPLEITFLPTYICVSKKNILRRH